MVISVTLGLEYWCMKAVTASTRPHHLQPLAAEEVTLQ